MIQNFAFDHEYMGTSVVTPFLQDLTAAKEKEKEKQKQAY